MRDQAAKLDGVTVQVEDAENDPEPAARSGAELRSSGVATIIVSLSTGTATPALTKMASDAGIRSSTRTIRRPMSTSYPTRCPSSAPTRSIPARLETQKCAGCSGGKGAAYVLMERSTITPRSSGRRTSMTVIATDECKGMSVIESRAPIGIVSKAANIMTNWLSTGRGIRCRIAITTRWPSALSRP